MAVLMAFLVVFLAMAGYSNAAYCICKDGVSSDLLQKDIDYACGQGGADCTAIHETGSCYNPNTVKDHCNYAVNSYYQKKNQLGASCDFSGTAILSPTIPTNSVSGCVYPSSAGAVTPTNPSIAPPGSSTTPGTVTPTNPATAPPGSTTTNPGMIPPPANPSIIAPPGSITTTPPGSSGAGTLPAFGGLGPTSGGFNPDGSGTNGGFRDHQGGRGLFASLALTVAVSSWIWFRV